MGIIAGQEIATVGLSYVGKLIYIPGADHTPVLNLNPTAVDCSSFVRLVVAKVAGRDLMGNGTTESYWSDMAYFGGLIGGSLQPGDLIERYGDGTYPPPGHIAICTSYIEATGQINCVSALGEAYGVRVDSILRSSQQFCGALRVANMIADPPPPPEEEMFLSQSWNGNATLLYVPETHTARGVDAIEAPFLLNTLHVPAIAAPLNVRSEYERIGALGDTGFVAFSEAVPHVAVLTEQP
jgi:hypothetical protein